MVTTVKSWVQAPADGAGKRLETDARATSGGTTVHREIIQIGGELAIAMVAGVGTSDPVTGSTALYVRSIPTSLRQPVISVTAASFGVTVAGTKRVQSDTAASFLANVTVLGTKRVQSDTAASFLVTMPGAKNVLSVTAASFNVTSINPGLSRVQSATAASFLVTVAGAKTVLSPTAASFNATVFAPGYVRDTSNTAASFVAKAYAYSITAGSFNVTVAGTKAVQSATAASFNVTVAGAKNVLSATAASFAVNAVNTATARSTWPTSEANNAAATFITDLTRRLEVIPFSHPEDTLGTTVVASLTVPISLFGAVASRRAYITSIMGSNSSGTNTTVDVFDRNTTGRRLAAAFIASAGGGFSLPMPYPIRGNTNSTVVVRVTPTVTSVLVTAQGFSAP